MAYIVHSVGSDDPNPLKHFRSYEDRGEAVAYAKVVAESADAERADIYWFVGSPYEAIQAIQRGDAKLLESRTPRASQAQLRNVAEKQWQKAEQERYQAHLNWLKLRGLS